MASLLIDESLPRSLADMLRGRGMDAIHVHEVDLTGETDTVLFDWARKEGRILITRDVGFGNLLTYPLGTHPGIVVVRVPFEYTADQIKRTVGAFFDQFPLEEVDGALIVVEPDRYRVRRASDESGSAEL